MNERDFGGKDPEQYFADKIMDLFEEMGQQLSKKRKQKDGKAKDQALPRGEGIQETFDRMKGVKVHLPIRWSN